MLIAMTTKPLQFIRKGQTVTLHGVEASRTLLDLLREDLHCTGTKEGCGEGDCGACTVVIGEAQGDRIKYSAINSCIRLAHSIDGMALWTVEDLEQHPAQQAMAQCHGSQCGFCTPGFVMSLFGLYQQHGRTGQPVTRTDAQHALSGNLCRCTGYRAILDAAQTMQNYPPVDVDEADLLQKLQQLAHAAQGLQADSAYFSPRTLVDLLQLRKQHPQAQLVAGCTDAGLWVTKQHRQFALVLDLTQVQELRRVEDYPHHIAIGAAVTLNDAFAALSKDRPHIAAFAHRFAGLPVRNSGTLSGNVANGSPIGDSMPLLIALGANIVLMSTRGHREMPLENFYTGYRQNLLAEDEVVAWIKVPKPVAGEQLQIYKVSKRFEDDISAVCLGVALHVVDGTVTQVRIGAGGVAATPVRALKTEAALRGKAWTQAAVAQAQQVIGQEFTPLSDMRASAAYRREVLAQLLQRFWLQSQGHTLVHLDDLKLEILA
jgi:xanthine dehydrogenase small subunit